MPFGDREGEPLGIRRRDPFRGGHVLTSDEREMFALQVMTEVRRWSGVEMRTHPSAEQAGEDDGVEFRLAGRQLGHMHTSCAVHLSLTKALKQSVVNEALAEPLTTSPESAWAMFNPTSPSDADRAIWLLRLNYVRFRRQRLTLDAAANSAPLQEHEAALATISSGVTTVVRKTQQRSKPRPLPELPAA